MCNMCSDRHILFLWLCLCYSSVEAGNVCNTSSPSVSYRIVTAQFFFIICKKTQWKPASLLQISTCTYHLGHRMSALLAAPEHSTAPSETINCKAEQKTRFLFLANTIRSGFFFAFPHNAHMSRECKSDHVLLQTGNNAHKCSWKCYNTMEKLNSCRQKVKILDIRFTVLITKTGKAAHLINFLSTHWHTGQCCINTCSWKVDIKGNVWWEMNVVFQYFENLLLIFLWAASHNHQDSNKKGLTYFKKWNFHLF